jgi:putative protein kinase ArgK-like GTPase of G3E family
MWDKLLQQIQSGDRKALARCISLVENEAKGTMIFCKNSLRVMHPLQGLQARRAQARARSQMRS